MAKTKRYLRGPLVSKLLEMLQYLGEIIMSQKATNNSTAIQAGRDVHIGLSYPEVKEIVYDLFKQNFPSLVAEAAVQAQSNVDEYVQQLDEVIKRKIDVIDINKFKEPNTQYLLNSTVILAARKGKSIDLGLLTETLVARLARDSNDMLDIVSEQALEIIPKITQQQINIISNIMYIMKMALLDLPDMSDAEESNKIIKDMTSKIGETTLPQLSYMASLGVLTITQFVNINPYVEIKNQYAYLYKDMTAEMVKDDIALKSPSLAIMAAIYEDNNLKIAHLTPVGILIALVNFRRIFPNIDYKKWIK